MAHKTFDNYPIWVVMIIIILQLSLYVTGSFIMFKLHYITGILYIIFVLFMESTIYREGCRDCFYYGKRCAFGRGLLAPLFVKKGDGKAFREKEVTFKDLIPQVLLSLIPVLVGIALLISRGFDALILIALLYPVILWFGLNEIIYGKLSCPHCKQGKICCPAMEFFMKKRGKK
ncbi:MAG: hypothetical protein ABIF92_02820 [archaeon]